jgi:hypothetical protein
MACRASKDEHGTTFTVPADTTTRTVGGQVLPACPAAEVWWARRFKDRREETLMIRQETPGNEHADVIELTLGQVYDLIHALGHAVMRT